LFLEIIFGGAHTSEVSGSAMPSLQVGGICGTLHRQENVRSAEGKKIKFHEKNAAAQLAKESKICNTNVQMQLISLRKVEACITRGNINVTCPGFRDE
jgi:hypothetical protein